MASVQLRDLDKTYSNGHIAVRGLTLDIADGELLVLVGPSGCGKSTVLRLVAGLETPTRGRVRIGDRDVTDLSPQDRDVAMVFQSYALYPHLNVRDNLAFGLRMRKTPRAVIDERVQKVARTLQLDQVLDRKPSQLSGGQRQRVALGRAMVREPQVFLLDEPLSNLDAKLRVQTRAELSRLHRQLGATMLYVSHDQEEAMTLGDRIAVLRDGQLQQVDRPLEVYRRPANAFVAGFIGSPSMNFFPGTLRMLDDDLRFESATVSLDLPANLSAEAGHSVLLGARPQEIRLVPPEQADLRARVDVIEPRGSELVIHVAATDACATVVAPPDTSVAINDVVGLRLDRERLHLFDAVSGQRIVPRR